MLLRAILLLLQDVLALLLVIYGLLLLIDLLLLPFLLLFQKSLDLIACLYERILFILSILLTYSILYPSQFYLLLFLGCDAWRLTVKCKFSERIFGVIFRPKDWEIDARICPTHNHKPRYEIYTVLPPGIFFSS